MTTLTEQAMRTFLVKSGWKQKVTSTSWSWSDPKAPGSLYRIRDAYMLEYARAHGTRKVVKR